MQNDFLFLCFVQIFLSILWFSLGFEGVEIMCIAMSAKNLKPIPRAIRAMKFTAILSFTPSSSNGMIDPLSKLELSNSLRAAA